MMGCDYDYASGGGRCAVAQNDKATDSYYARGSTIEAHVPDTTGLVHAVLPARAL